MHGQAGADRDCDRLQERVPRAKARKKALGWRSAKKNTRDCVQRSDLSVDGVSSRSCLGLSTTLGSSCCSLPFAAVPWFARQWGLGSRRLIFSSAPPGPYGLCDRHVPKVGGRYLASLESQSAQPALVLRDAV